MKRRVFLGENVPVAVFAQWRGRPLYILLVFLLGQCLVTAPAFFVGTLFTSFVTGVALAAFLAPVAGIHLIMVALALWFYTRFSRTIRRFLQGLLNLELVDAKTATAAWREAALFPQRVVASVIAVALVAYVLQSAILVSRFGLLATIEGGFVALTVVVWFALVLFLFYLEGAMRPILRLTLAAGARPALGDLRAGRLRLGSKLQVLTLAVIAVPAATAGVFAYSQLIAQGSDPLKALWLTGLVVAIASSAALLVATLMVRSVVSPVQEIQRAINAVAQGNLAARASPLTTDELAELGLHFNHMVEQIQQQEPLKAAFGRYVSEAVRDGILSGQICLGGERREITILFTDIRDFTTWCEQAEPEGVVQTLNSYYSNLVQALAKYGGVVTRYTGDGVLALFGAPLDDPNHALHAVQAAWEAKALLDKFNEIRRSLAAFELRTCFGIHTGVAVVGSIGCETRAEYTPIGDAANVASRIEGLNRELGTSILISATTYERVAGRIVAGRQAEVMVKGRTTPVRVVEVAGFAERAAQEGT